ncbi:cell surface glycoprotein CD200 receptor 1-A [Pungitius pungitius]|uniref:cell surface glycoprotein CD200 receptor 1-A n=1 Tax=Pungitius pungitius TaxID=134920 RepID=UPI0018874854|nr:cell surface glycoprotein CD200 receptor 1-A [Pungitius pungitius]
MRDTMWIYAVFTFLLSEAWSMDEVVSYVAFNQGSEVNLTCINETRKEVLFVSWNIEFKNKRICRISFIDGRSDDLCKDGKSLWNTSSGLSYLHIPNISETDEGQYKCESVYTGGNDHHVIHVAITVPPSVSAWIYHKDNKVVAVCKAERGKPAANISWNHMENVSSVQSGSNGYFTVESRLELLEGMNTENLSCAISHPSWERIRIIVPKLQKGHSLWLYALIVGLIIVISAGLLVFAQKKIIPFRRCQQSNLTQSKSPPAEDVEEVEPYASYVQRVNSIYNSSADLFT